MILLGNEDQVGIAIAVEVGRQHMFAIMRLGAESALLPGEVPLPVIDVESVWAHLHRQHRVPIVIAVYIHQCDIQGVEIFGNRHMRVGHVVK
jgi:hypothetical protein